MSEAKARELLRDVETLLMIVEPRSHKAEYIALLDLVRAYLAAVPAPPAGPPREPTIAMINAGQREFMDNDDWDFGDIWRAMYDAAPAAEPVAQPVDWTTPVPLSVEHEDGKHHLTAAGEALMDRALRRSVTRVAGGKREDEPVAQPTMDDGPAREAGGAKRMDSAAGGSPPGDAAASGSIGDSKAAGRSGSSTLTGGEPVAQQPPPRVQDSAAFTKHEHGESANSAQPEAPTLADDPLVRRLRNTPNWLREEYGNWKDATSHYDRAPFEAAARIESDARVISENCAELARLYAGRNELQAELAASRERERGAYERAARVCDELDEGFGGIPISEIAKRIRALATPDSAASPTGGEG